MGDTTNWEFAAAVSAVVIGLGGMLVFTIIGAIGSWRVYDSARRSMAEADKASAAVQEIARSLRAHEAFAAAEPYARAADDAARRLSDLRLQSDGLMEQQRQLREAVRGLAEARALHGNPEQQLNEISVAIKRIEEHLSQIAAGVVNLTTER